MVLRKLAATFSVVVVFMSISMVALAHNDGGVDETFIAPEMNQPSYWENRFGNVECFKFEGHYGNIPSWVDIAIVHDAQKVRVYNPAPGFVLGPQNTNGNNANKDKHYDAPHSWIMKCRFVEPTTTTTIPETTSTTVIEDTTTTTEVEESTTTTLVENTTSTTEITTFTTVSEGPTTSQPTDIDTTVTVPVEELPYTGANTSMLILSGMMLFALAVLAFRKSYRYPVVVEEDNSNTL